MVWNKVSVNVILLFCEEWRSREEIKEKFDMSATESWHCVRWLSKLRHEVIIEKRVGLTGRKYMYKSRIRTIEAIKEGRKDRVMTKDEILEISSRSENTDMDGDEELPSAVTMKDVAKFNKEVKEAEHDDLVKEKIESAEEDPIADEEKDRAMTPEEIKQRNHDEGAAQAKFVGELKAKEEAEAKAKAEAEAEAKAKAEEEAEKEKIPEEPKVAAEAPVVEEKKEEPLHKSDCAVHNAPAEKPGECDCGVTEEKKEETVEESKEDPQ